MENHSNPLQESQENYQENYNEMNQLKENSINNENDNDEDSGEGDDSKRRNKRRSKNDTDGRTYRCSICDKSYLSYPALYTHIKTKHNTNGQSSGRGRGRPKKDLGDNFNSSKSLYNPLTSDYFKSPEKIGETPNIVEVCDEVAKDVFAEGKLEKKFENFFENPLIVKMLEAIEAPKSLDGETSKCDEIFADYLAKCSKLCRPEFYSKLLKFVFLFRECLNSMYKDKAKTDEGLDYSECTNAEDAPDISNEFVTEFLDAENQKFGINKEDAIDLTQNFCQWLYDNNFTCSKLSLINNNY